MIKKLFRDASIWIPFDPEPPIPAKVVRAIKRLKKKNPWLIPTGKIYTKKVSCDANDQAEPRV